MLAQKVVNVKNESLISYTFRLFKKIVKQYISEKEINIFIEKKLS